MMAARRVFATLAFIFTVSNVNSNTTPRALRHGMNNAEEFHFILLNRSARASFPQRAKSLFPK